MVWVAVATCGALSFPASAIPIVGRTDPINNTADFEYSRESAFSLRIGIENTSNYDARITGFGFDVLGGTAYLLGSVSGTLNDDDWQFSYNAIGGRDDLDAFAITGPNLWGGNPRSGIAVGDTGTFDFWGLFGQDLAVTNIVVRFQRTGSDKEGSDKGYACMSNCTPVGVPEPSSLGLLGFGLVGLWLAMRRRRAEA